MPNWVSLLKTVPWGDVIANAPAVASGAKKLWQNVAGRVDELVVDAKEVAPGAGTATPSTANSAAAGNASNNASAAASPGPASSAASGSSAWATQTQLEAVAQTLAETLGEQLGLHLDEQLSKALKSQTELWQATQARLTQTEQQLAQTQNQLSLTQQALSAVQAQADLLAVQLKEVTAQNEAVVQRTIEMQGRLQWMQILVGACSLTVIGAVVVSFLR